MKILKYAYLPILFLLFFLGIISNTGYVAAQEAVLYWDFENEPLDTFRHNLVEVKEDCGVGGSKCIRVTYLPCNAENPCGNGSQVIVFDEHIPPALEYTLNYDVMFEEGFEFVKGGKLHGFEPDDGGAACTLVDPYSWDSRIMFSNDDGALRIYYYHQDKVAICGDTVFPNPPDPGFNLGQYYSVSLHTRMNDPATESNGFARLFVNGKLIAEKSNIRWRAVEGESTKITKFHFTTFHGGGDWSYAPSKTVYARFDNFAVYPGEKIRQGTPTDPPLTSIPTPVPTHSPTPTVISVSPTITPLNTVIFQPTDDAYLQDEIAYNNDFLRLEAGTRVRKTYMKFNITGIGEKEVVDSKLIIRQTTDSGTGTLGAYEGSHSNWTESTLTSVNKPLPDLNVGSTTSTFDNENFYEIPITGITTDGIYSLILQMESGGVDTEDIGFSSKEGIYSPQLEIQLGEESLFTADANGDQTVSGEDFIIWLTNYDQDVYGTSNGDYNENGYVGFGDYIIWLANFSS